MLNASCNMLMHEASRQYLGMIFRHIDVLSITRMEVWIVRHEALACIQNCQNITVPHLIKFLKGISLYLSARAYC